MNPKFTLCWSCPEGQHIHYLAIHEDDIQTQLDRLKSEGSQLLSLRREGY